MNWFESWFNSKYYHKLYKNRDSKEAEKFINNLVSKLNLKENSNLIDIACGKGRHARYFNKKGLNVTGVDLSQNSINYASNFTTQTLSFHVHDMRRSFKKNYFDIATNLFTSFGYFEKEEDDLLALKAMAKNLKKNGILIIDFMNTEKILKNLISHEEKYIDNIKFSIKRYIENNIIIKEIKITDEKKQYNFLESVRNIKLNDFKKMISKSNLRIIDMFGDYELNEFNIKYSDRLILVCKKQSTN